jgi:pimeloyl-ACP methyl ester carboxylesterase
VAVMDTLHLKKASFVGWSDGAVISLIMAMKSPERVNSVYAFGANMNTDAVVSGALTSPILSEVAARLAKDYARISSYTRRIRHSSPGTRNDAEEGAQLHDEGTRCYQSV